VNWADLATPIGCVFLLLLALARGWLVSGRELDRHSKIWEARLKEAHERETVWQQVALTREETTRNVADQYRTRQVVDEVVVRTIAAAPAPEGD